MLCENIFLLKGFIDFALIHDTVFAEADNCLPHTLRLIKETLLNLLQEGNDNWSAESSQHFIISKSDENFETLALRKFSQKEKILHGNYHFWRRL